MKAIICRKYGPPSVLTVEMVEKPVPGDNGVLVRVMASTVNRTDCAILRAKPFIMRFFTGLFKPKNPVLGTEFAGRIEAVGKKVGSFKVGDRVFGFDDLGLGSHAQYLAIGEDKGLANMPANMTYAQAAAATEGAHYGYNFINKVGISAGQRILINGASGGIGSATLQLAKHLGADVTAVCDTKNLELMASLGADRTIDYTKQDFTQDAGKYDFIFDAVGKSSFGKCRPMLKPGGVYISSELGAMAQNIFLALVTPLLGGRKVVFPVPSDIKATLRLIGRLMEEGRFKPVVDREYPLERIAEAYGYVEQGLKTGNVVITVQAE